MKNYQKKIMSAIPGIKSLESKLQQLNKQDEILALQLLNNLLPKSIFIPLTLWSISPSTVLHIANEIVINNRKSIIEIGSGFSTLVIAQLIKSNNLDIEFCSVESNKEWIQILKDQLKKEKLFDHVNIIYAPLTSSSYTFKQHKNWYDVNILDKFLANKFFDLVIVDGPPGNEKYSRFGAISYLQNKLKKDFFILLDDTYRPEEYEIIEEWSNILKVNFQKFNVYSIISNSITFDSRPIYFRLF